MPVATFGHLATYSHNQHGPKYVHDGYPRKEHEKTNSPVKISSDLDYWLKSYDKNKNFEFSPYVSLQCKHKKSRRRSNLHGKFKISFEMISVYMYTVLMQFRA